MAAALCDVMCPIVRTVRQQLFAYLLAFVKPVDASKDGTRYVAACAPST